MVNLPARAASGRPAVSDRLLTDVPLLAPLPRDVIADLADRVVGRSVAAGTTLVHEGEPATSLHIVLSGQVALQRGARGHLLRVRGPGEVFGEVQLFDRRTWGYSALAMTPVDVALAARPDVLGWIGRHPAAAELVLRHLAQRLSHDDRVPDGALRLDVPTRLARALLVLAERYAEHGVVRHGLSQQQLGDLVGASREAVNKALGDFSDAGWIRHYRQGFILYDRGSLQQRADCATTAGPPPPSS